MLDLLPRDNHFKTILIGRILELQRAVNFITDREKQKFCTQTLDLNRALLLLIFKETWL